MYQSYSQIVSSSQSTEYTGSIVKAYVIANGTILNSMWGDPDQGHTSLTLTGSQFVNVNIANFTDTMTLGAESVGTYIEGPIGRIKVGTAGLLLYFK